MIRTILKPDKSQLMLQLPDDMIGKTIEIIAFEIEQAKPVDEVSQIGMLGRVEAIDKALRKHRVDLSNFKFDRDEANNYE